MTSRPRSAANRSSATRTAKPGSAAPEVNWLELDRQLCFALYSTSLAMTRLYKPHLDALGLTYPQYLVMLALWQQDGLGVGELGQRLFLDSGTLTPLLKRLESAGLVLRQRSAADERRVEVSLTPAGRALRAAARGIPASVAAATGCSLTELVDLTRRLHGLRERLDSQAAA